MLRDTWSVDVAGDWVAEEVSIAYGGVAAKTVMAPRVQAALQGQPWTGVTLDKALAAVAEDINIAPNAPGLLLYILCMIVSLINRFCFVDEQ